jgi:serine/threonine-protein kinase RsbW
MSWITEHQAHRYETHLLSHVDELMRLDSLLTELFQAWEVPEELQGGILVAITEAVSNAILHGNKQDPSKKVRLLIERTAELPQLRVVVEDEGEGFDPASIPDPTTAERLLSESGRGIFLMRAFADEVTYQKGGRCVELKFQLGE